MAVTHKFTDDLDFAKGGSWFDDYGSRICKWSWDPVAKILSVECGFKGRKVDLNQFNEESLCAENLRQRLPTLALETAESLKKTKYDV